MIALVPVIDRYARRLWPQIEAWIASAVADTGDWWHSDDVLVGIESGGLTLWVVTDEDEFYGVVVCEVEVAPRKRVGVIALCAGRDQSEWLHLLPEVEGWARENGCSEVQVRGRPGWARRLKSQGYGERYIAVGKGLQ